MASRVLVRGWTQCWLPWFRWDRDSRILLWATPSVQLFQQLPNMRCQYVPVVGGAELSREPHPHDVVRFLWHELDHGAAFFDQNLACAWGIHDDGYSSEADEGSDDVPTVGPKSIQGHAPGQ